MARIWKKSDRIPVRIGDITVRLSPLSKDEKVEIQTAMVRGRAKGDISEYTKGVYLALKYAVKGVEGIQDSDGNAYKLEFDSDGSLTENCVSDLLNMEEKNNLVLCCSALVSKVPDEFTDETGKKLEGVEIIKTGNPSPNS